MTDETEGIRRQLVHEQLVNGPLTREQLEEQHGQVWDKDEVHDFFEILYFQAPFVVVRRKLDGVLGSLEFQVVIGARFYYNFVPDRR